MSKWFFPRLNGGEEQGLNESGIHQFKKRDRLGRETCQNIGDVSDDTDNPAIATFEKIDLPMNEFPGRDDLIKCFESCKEYVLKNLPNGTGNEEVFFNNAIELLRAESIPVLRIGDRNTTGLTGNDDDRTQPFYRLLKLQGASSPQGNGGGTYGIGQRAPFAHSALRTVLYSTRTEEGRAFIGKTILASFPDPSDGKLTQSKGWYCKENPSGDSWSTIRTEADIPNRFKRDEIGTDLWVTGFISENWEQDVRHSVLQHFFASIANGQLVVELKSGDDILSISSSNLEEELVRAAAEAKAKITAEEYRKGLGSTLYYYQALKNPYNGQPFERVITKLGNCKFFLTRDEKNKNMPDRWATMRKPKIIVNSHGSGLLNRFAAVFLSDTEDGNHYLAQLEDPTHERWHEDETRNWSTTQKNEAKRVLSEIRAFAQDILKEVRGNEMQTEQDIPFLGRYLPAEDDDPNDESDSADALTREITERESGELVSSQANAPIKGTALAPSPPAIITIDEDEIEDEDSDNIGNKDAGRDQQDNQNYDDTDNPRELEKQTGGVISPNKVRFRSFKIDGDFYCLIVESLRRVSGDLKIIAVGEEGHSNVDLVGASALDTGEILRIQESRITGVSLGANEKLKLKLAIKNSESLCLGLEGKNEY